MLYLRLLTWLLELDPAPLSPSSWYSTFSVEGKRKILANKWSSLIKRDLVDLNCSSPVDPKLTISNLKQDIRHQVREGLLCATQYGFAKIPISGQDWPRDDPSNTGIDKPCTGGSHDLLLENHFNTGIEYRSAKVIFARCQVTGFKQQILRMRFTVTSFKQQVGAGHILCLVLVLIPSHCLAQNLFGTSALDNLANMMSHFGTL